MNCQWNRAFIAQNECLAVAQLQTLFDLAALPDWPNANGLQQLKHRLALSSESCPDFICQSELSDSAEYYEQYIFAYQRIPTRPNNWHDLFNALVWLQFPRTKRLLNQQHMADINQFGLNPRTLRRNNLTHFDECGVIVTVEMDDEYHALLARHIDPLALLSEHQWQQVFIDYRHLWGNQLNSFMFGHANLEMLLQPFIGLTGKWLALPVPVGFSQRDYATQVAIVDELLAAEIAQNNIFATKRLLKPLPLLGIPGYCAANQQPAYYANQEYFRPKRRA